jgi:hypothetical protein
MRDAGRLLASFGTTYMGNPGTRDVTAGEVGARGPPETQALRVVVVERRPRRASKVVGEGSRTEGAGAW